MHPTLHIQGGRYRIDAVPKVVYGVLESTYNIKVDEAWLESKFDDMDIYYDSVDSEESGTCIYGYSIQLNQQSGQLDALSDEKKRKVMELYNILKHHHAVNHSQDMPNIGYFNAVSIPDSETEYDEYVPIPLPAHAAIANNAQNEDPTNGGSRKRQTRRKTIRKRGRTKYRH